MKRRTQVAIGIVIGFIAVVIMGGCEPHQGPYPQPTPTPLGWS